MSESSPRLARSAGLFGLATMTSRLLGLVRDQVLAFYFGAGDAMDAFRVAFRVPNLLRDLFAEGAMSAAFVPTFTKALARGGRPRAWELASSVMSALVLITSVLVVCAMLFAEPLVRLYAADFAQVPGKLSLTVELTRIMAPFLTLVALAAVAMGMLNTLGHFFVPALSPAMFNIATIVMALTLVPFAPLLGLQPIVIIAVSTLVGGLAQLAVQWPPLRNEGFTYRPRLDFRDEGLRQVLLLMGPGTIGMAATQMNVLVNTILATGEGTGAVSWLDFAFRVMYLPIGLFGVSIAAASTPTLSRLAHAHDHAGMRSTVASAIGLMLALNVPATFGLIVLAEPIVALIYQYGRFTASDTAATAAALQFYAIGLVGYSVVRIVSPVFYALDRSRVPVATSAASVLVNVVLNLVLVRAMGYRGLALGTSVTAVLNAVLQFWLLRQHLGGIDGTRIANTFARILLAASVMAVVAWGADRAVPQLVADTTPIARLLGVALTIGAALGALAISSHVLRIQEFDEARRLVLRRFRRKRP
ncbi:MAG: murein biosynthesis integral membrane protein MurJ [Acidobacteria bacterium]|nr:murein biosynthesis integral membrane protein MurJ [Acidobacteriota bacterium]